MAADPEPYLDTAVYHCQQAAEKVAKAYLVSRDQRFDKIHDIRLLIDVAMAAEPALEKWLEVGEPLLPEVRP